MNRRAGGRIPTPLHSLLQNRGGGRRGPETLIELVAEAEEDGGVGCWVGGRGEVGEEEVCVLRGGDGEAVGWGGPGGGGVEEGGGCAGGEDWGF